MNVEDYIELLTTNDYTLEKSDYNLIYSFVKQIHRGLSFTDRQYELAKQKILDYESQFVAQGLNPTDDLENLRLPVRSIDRSRWVKIVNDQGPNRVYESEKAPFIAVRFTFQKKLISMIEDIKKATKNEEMYDKETKVHYFQYSEKTLYAIIEAVKDKNFEIDSQCQEIYEKLKTFKQEDYVPGVYNLQLKNLNSAGTKMLTDEVGELTKDNLILFKDRSIKYGLHHVDEVVRGQESVLAFKIANRKRPAVAINNTVHSLDALFTALDELNRYPIMFVVPNADAYNQIVDANRHAKSFIPAEQTSVMFRLDNQGEGLDFNNYIKKENINNKLDIDTKLVYTIDHTVPKPLLQSGWTPKAIIVSSPGSVPTTRKSLECFSNVDLIIHYQDEVMPSYRFFYKSDVERI